MLAELSNMLSKMFCIVVKLFLFLLGTSAALSMQFSSPKCDQLSSTELSFVVELWKIKPYTNCTITSTKKEMSSLSPAEGWVSTFYFLQCHFQFTKSKVFRVYRRDISYCWIFSIKCKVQNTPPTLIWNCCARCLFRPSTINPF